jgi:hypothetical protein
LGQQPGVERLAIGAEMAVDVADRGACHMHSGGLLIAGLPP